MLDLYSSFPIRPENQQDLFNFERILVFDLSTQQRKMESLDILGPLDLNSCLFATISGFIIGFERQWNGKPAGIRTSILISLGASIFVALGAYYQPAEGTVRIIVQIVTGIGFLGAGVIIAREGLVKGVTSASVIWVLAGIGCLAGLKFHFTALLISVITVLILVGITYLEKGMTKLKRGVHKNLDPDQTSVFVNSNFALQ